MESRGSEDRRDAVSIDLLNACVSSLLHESQIDADLFPPSLPPSLSLHSIPIQSLAVNGPSLVQKVRFVASSLLDDPDQSRINTFLLGE